MRMWYKVPLRAEEEIYSDFVQIYPNSVDKADINYQH